MKISWRSEVAPLVLIALSFVLAAVAWPHAPDRVPVHWGIGGQPDRYAGKLGLFYPSFIALGLYALLLFLPRIDPRGRNYDRFRGSYTVVRTAAVASLVGIQTFTVLWAFGIHADLNVAVPVIVGLLLVVIGNYLGKFRPNWFAGIRTPWTLSSTESWNRTHRLGGRLFVLLGLALVIAAVIHQPWAFATVAALAGVVIVVLAVYSYWVWKQDPEAHRRAGRPDRP